jgi:hypothetical protein
MQAKTMDNNFSTGSPKIDFVLLGVAWLFAFIDWKVVPVALSCMASVFVIVKQGLDMYDRWKNKRTKRKR